MAYSYSFIPFLLVLSLSKSFFSLVFVSGVNLQERVGGALSCVKVVLFVRECREPKTGQFGVVFDEEVTVEITLLVKNGDETIFASLSEVVACDEEFLLLDVHGKGSGPKAARELMEDAGVENSRRVNDDSEDTVLERFGNVKNGLVLVHSEAGGMGKTSVDDRLEHGDVEFDHE